MLTATMSTIAAGMTATSLFMVHRRDWLCARLGSLGTGFESRMLFASRGQFFEVGVAAIRQGVRFHTSDIPEHASGRDVGLHQSVMDRPRQAFKAFEFGQCGIELRPATNDPVDQYPLARPSPLIADRNSLVTSSRRRGQDPQAPAARLSRDWQQCMTRSDDF